MPPIRPTFLISVVVLLGILFLALAPITTTVFSAIGGLFDKSSPAPEANEHAALAVKKLRWHHQGLTGTYDRAALQRGFQVYKQVCSTCHSMGLLSYRNLSDLGFNDAEVKALAASGTVADGPNDQGEMFQRPGRPADMFIAPFANDKAARAANNGALPPDLSLIVKARSGGENYIYSILTGFGQTPPGDEKIAAGMYYNPYFAGHQIAMPPPLSENSVTYSDGTAASIDQEARDVAQFLTWASEPKMETRKQTGLKVVSFLVIFAFVMFRVKKRIWMSRKIKR